MARITLDDLNSRVEEKFGDFEMEAFNVDSKGSPVIDDEGDVVVLRFCHYLRAPKERRAELRKAFEMAEETDPKKLEEFYGEDVDVTSALVTHFSRVMRALAAEPKHADILEAALGEDSIKWTYLLNLYAEHIGVDAGESEPSNS